MLTIKDISGKDLVANAPAAVSYPNHGAATVAVTVQAVLIEDDPYLTSMLVNGTLSWNDGSLPIPYVATSGTQTISASKSLANGNYLISVYGQNSKAPTPDAVRVNFPVSVVPDSTPAVTESILFGPILPRDSGYPSPDQWCLNSGSDNLILESSIRMLLLTRKGERVMEPNYGTNIRRLLFDPNISGIEKAVQEEIESALTTWEPRLGIKSLVVIRPDNDTAVTVNVEFTSRLAGQVVGVSLDFTP